MCLGCKDKIFLGEKNQFKTLTNDIKTNFAKLMKQALVHHNLVEAVIKALDKIFNKDQYADKVVEATLKSQKKWGSRDRRFVAHAIYECVRWKRYYMAVSETENHVSRENLVNILSVYLLQNNYQLPDLYEFQSIDNKKIAYTLENSNFKRSIKESIPEWLDELGEKQLGEQWKKEISALNKQAKVVIRVNTLKTNIKVLQGVLKNEGIETHTIENNPDALTLDNRTNISYTSAYKNGMFEIQDASSQLVAPFLQVKPNETVIDACAGGGGKSLHLASLMQNKGEIIAMDIYESKLKNLEKRAKRNGVNIIKTQLVEDIKQLKPLFQTADKVLIDAPCSALGVLRRNPDTKWKLNIQFIKDLEFTQTEILETYAPLVKIGGQIVYATCSILPSENELIVKKFLNKNKAYKFVRELKVLPSISGYDGFYMALIKRIN